MDYQSSIIRSYSAVGQTPEGRGTCAKAHIFLSTTSNLSWISLQMGPVVWVFIKALHSCEIMREKNPETSILWCQIEKLSVKNTITMRMKALSMALVSA